LGKRSFNSFFLALKYKLSDELMINFIPYNESLGETNYNLRINDDRKRLEERKGSVLCKKCYKEYKLNKSEFCPKCGEKYKFDISDVMHEYEWYEEKENE
jgi:PHP family Zn ribbon phosphoesterase